MNNNEVEIRLWNSYDNFRGGRIDASVVSLKKSCEIILSNDKSLEKDVFWKLLSIDVFTCIALNNFYNNNGVTLSDIYEIIISKDEVKKNIEESNENFKNNNYVKKIENITEKMLNSVIDVLSSNIFNYLIHNTEFYYCYFSGSTIPSRKIWYSLNVLDDIIIINEKTEQNSSIKISRNKEIIEKQKQYISNNIEKIKELSGKKLSAQKSSSRKHLYVIYNGEKLYINMLVNDNELKEECSKIILESNKNLNLQDK